MNRLSELTHALARRAMNGEHGRLMQLADFSMADAGSPAGESPDLVYARAVRLIAERAPLRLLPGELIAGSATLKEATRHQTPVLGEYSTSHTTPGFDRVLQVGYAGLRQQVETRLSDDVIANERLLRGKQSGCNAAERDFLQAMLICLDAAGIWHRRHMQLLEQRIAGSAGAEQDAYLRVQTALRPVPENPPATFHQALQSLWFSFAFQRLCGNWPGLGRIDQMLAPFLQADLDAGRITLDEARELLAHFWIKGCEWTDGSSNGSGDAQYYQNVVLSGIDADGQEATNPVTYLILDVVEELGISDYPIAVRISPRTPEKLLRRTAEVMRRGGGIVAVYNEDRVIDALQRFGYPLAEARSFANDGCWEVLIPGQTAFGYAPFDLLGLLQEVLRVNRPELPPADYGSFEELYTAFAQRLEQHLELFHRQADGHELGGRAAPLLSLLVEDCIQKGRGYHDRGARYTVLAPHAGGLPDAANALLAIQTIVYQEKTCTLAELVAILRDDWQGQEPLRLRVRNRLALYGNDDAQADAMTRRVFDTYTYLAGELHDRNGVLRPPGLSTFGRQIEWSPGRGATASGSRRGEYLANNFSPAPGTDKGGPTAVIKSFCSVDYAKLPNGTALDLKIHPSGLHGEDGLAALVGLLRSFVYLGGWFMHIDVVDSQALRQAQLHPEQYAHLAVRISGWSARFVTLNREWQEMIIQRTEQELR